MQAIVFLPQCSQKGFSLKEYLVLTLLVCDTGGFRLEGYFEESLLLPLWSGRGRNTAQKCFNQAHREAKLSLEIHSVQVQVPPT